MKKILIITALFSFLLSTAQNDKMLERAKKQWEPIKTKPLCVVLGVENEKYVEKLTKKKKEQEVKNYKNLIANYNTFIKSSVNEYVKEFTSIKYITTTEFKNMDKKDKKSNAFLVRTFPEHTGGMVSTGFNNKPSFGGMGGGNTFAMASIEGIPENIDLDTTNVKDASIIKLLSWNDDELFPYYSQQLTKLFCTNAEVSLSMRQLNNSISNSINKISAKETEAKILTALKTKTLIINKNSLSDNLTETDIKKVYPNTFKIVEQAEYENILLSKKDDVVLLLVLQIASSQGMFGDTHQLFEPSTNTTHIPNVQKCVGKIKKEHFEWYTKAVY